LQPAGLGQVLIKPECIQATGSFKVRGAFNALLKLYAERPGTAGVVTVSSGNHGQAVAYAARSLGLAAVVVMPEQASAVKREAIRRLGARIVNQGVTTANREQRFREVVTETGFVPVHPFDDWDVIHGQGTVGLEVADDLPEVETVVVPVGGGGLISGVALALAYRGTGARVVGVEPAAADDARQSLDAGHVVEQVAGPTIADGAMASRVGERPASVLLEQRLVDEIVTVTDEELIGALPTIWSESRLLVEPTGALALTAVLTGRVAGDGATVAVISGGNVGAEFVVSTLTEASRRT
jgi:threonine dehydratase